MATELAKAYVQIIPSARGIKDSISKELGGEASSAGKAAGENLGSNLISSLKGIIAAAGIGKLIKDSLMEGADLQQSIGGVETLYKEAAGAIKDYADSSWKFGLSANDYMEQSTQFAAVLQKSLGGDVVKAAEMANLAINDMADNSAKMGTDMQSIQNAYNGLAKGNATMLDNLKIGYGGTQTEMLKLAKDMGVVDESVKSFNDMSFDQAILAIHKMQEQLGVTGVAADEAKTTFTGSLQAMKASAQNLLGNLSLGEDIGPSLSALGATVSAFFAGNLLPMVGNIIRSAPKALVGAIQQGGDMLKKVLIDSIGLDAGADSSQIVEKLKITITQISENAGKLLQETIVPNIKAAIPSILEGITSGVDILGHFDGIVASMLPELLAAGQDIAMELINGIIRQVPQIIQMGGTLMENLLKSVEETLPNLLSSGLEIVNTIVAGIRENIPTLADMALTTVTDMAGFFLEYLPNLMSTGAEMLMSISDGITSMIPGLLESGKNAMQNLMQEIKDNLPDILATGMEILKNIVNGITETIPDLLDIGNQVIDDFLGAITDLLPDILETGTEMINTMVDGILQSFPGIISAAFDAIVAFVDGILKSLPSIFKSGVEILMNLIHGIENMLPDLLRAGAKLIGDLIITILKNIPNIIKSGVELIGGLIKGLTQTGPKAKSGMAAILKGLWDAVKDVDWLELGKDIIRGLINGIGAMGDALWQAARNIASSALDAIKGFFGIHSPSRRMRDEVGKFIPMGIAVGIEKNAGAVKDAMGDLSDMVADTDLTAKVRTAAQSGSLAPGKAQRATGPMAVTVEIGNFINQSDRDLDSLAETLAEKIQAQVARREVALA